MKKQKPFYFTTCTGQKTKDALKDEAFWESLPVLKKAVARDSKALPKGEKLTIWKATLEVVK